jgi:hypothetical protein
MQATGDRLREHFTPASAWLFICVLALAAGLFPSPSVAQDLEPRLYSNAPPGVNFVVAGYAYSEGNVLPDPSVGIENAQLEVDGPLFGFARSLAIAEDSAQVAVAAARVCLDGSAEYAGQTYTRDVCGLTDLRVRLGWNFLGAPAMDLREFASYQQDLILGAALNVSVPVGDYDPERLVNIGTNRWAVRAELGLSKAIARWTLELSASAAFFETNDDFFGGSVRSQDPMYSLQGHVIYGFASGIWVAADATFYRGGRTTTDGNLNNDLQSSSRVGVTVSFPVNRRQSVKVAASTGATSRVGTDFDTITATWQYRFGAGL